MREGRQHCQRGTPAFLARVLKRARRVSDAPLLLRLDGGNDALEPGKYVEGVVLSDNLEALFRNVPPPLSLALAMTEKHEKAERAAIMRERNCSKIESVYVIAENIINRRHT